ncbi:MAG TPA: ArsR family transcriptional regulator [Tepidiformaceae bacterium]|nr:ArsR family transcriptional regulator [Tepidiformaceae bacterium]
MQPPTRSALGETTTDPGAQLSKIHREVLETLVRQREWRAEELASALYLSEGAARTHLNVLADLGLVQVRLERQGPGRPRHFYSISSRGRSTFGTGYMHWLLGVLELLQERHPEVYAAIGDALARDAMPTPSAPADALDRRRDELSRHLTELGHRFSIQESGAETRVTVFNCGAFRAAQRHRWVCDTEVAWAARFFPEMEATLRGCMADGQPSCLLVFTPREGQGEAPVTP